jgi:NAD(P)-dependent dehydrogenase (short-subunit alcohol dehydrogenase family)
MKTLVAIVAGGAGGIGFATSTVLAARGVTVVIADKEDSLTNLTSRLSPEETPDVVTCDVTDPQLVQRAIDDVVERHGRLDVLINAAGISGVAPSLDLSHDDWRRVLDVNVTGTFLMCQAAGRVMAAQGGGAIVNVASLAGLGGVKNMAHYCAAKHAVVGLTRALSTEWAGLNIRVNCVCPGATDTSLLARHSSSSEREAISQIVPLRRIGHALDQANAIAFLSGPESAYISGAVVPVDGGVMAMLPTGRDLSLDGEALPDQGGSR